MVNSIHGINNVLDVYWVFCASFYCGVVMISQNDWPNIKEGQVVYAVSLSTSYDSSSFMKIEVEKATEKQVKGKVNCFMSSVRMQLRSDYYLFDNYHEAAEFYCSKRIERKIESRKKEIQKLRDQQHKYLHELKDLP